jgi:hypothetical protein
MLTDEVDVASGIKVNMTRVTAIALLLAAGTACTAERALTPEPPAPDFAMAPATAASQVPLLFVVDGVKYQRDQLQLLTDDRIYAVRVIKGRAALQQYGQDAAYGVVIITTRQAATPRS